jgi:hypothetical protein
MRFLIAILGCFVVVTAADAQPPGIPQAAPRLHVVRETTPAKGAIVLIHLSVEQVPVEVEETVIKDGEKIVVKKIVYKGVYVERSLNIDATKSRIITRDGKQVPIEEVWKRLKPNIVVAVSADENAPAAPFLHALSEETLIIIPVPPAPVAPPKQ